SEDGPALCRRNLLRVQDSQDRQSRLVGRVCVPISGALDAIPIHFAVAFDICEPRHLRMFRMPILDQRMHAWRTKPAAEGGECARTKVLVAEHKHRMFGECPLDPNKGRIVEWS